MQLIRRLEDITRQLRCLASRVWRLAGDVKFFLFINDHRLFNMPRIKNRRVHVKYQTLGLSTENYDMNLALTIVREMGPDLKVRRVVEKQNKTTVVEVRGSRDDIAQFNATYNIRWTERVVRENPDIDYDTLKIAVVEL